MEVSAPKEYGAEPAPETRKLANKVQAPRKGESIETPGFMIARGPRSAICPEAAPIVGQPEAWRRPTTRFSYRVVATSGAVVLGIVLIAAVLSLRGGDSSEPAAVAVLPLRDLGDSTTTSIGEAIAEELTTSLAQLPGVAVRSSTRSKAVLRDARDIEEIGRRLNVKNVVDGSVQRESDKLRVTVRLVRASDGFTLWARSFDLTTTDLLSSQARIAAATVVALAPLLVSESPKPAPSSR